MSDFIKRFWRERLGVGPGDKIVAFKDREYLITNIHNVTTWGTPQKTVNICIEYESFYQDEHGEIYDIYNLIDWNKTKLFNEAGDLLGKCQRKNIDLASILAYEPIFTPKRHKVKAYLVRTPGIDCGVIKYTPKEFEERFDVIEQFIEVD